MSLFKYLHPDRTDVLRGQALRYSSPAVLNDPFELKPHLTALASSEYLVAEFSRLLPQLLIEELAHFPPEIRKLILSDMLGAIADGQVPQMQQNFLDMAKILMSEHQRTIAKKFEELFGILCLSESAENLLMWAHYADSHHGFVIEFNENSPFFDRRVSQDDELRHLRKVIYSRTRPALTLAEVEDFSPFMTKGKDWEYEAEWRMIMPLHSASRIMGVGPTAVHLFEFPSAAIKSLIFGCRMSKDKKTEIKDILARSPMYSHVACYAAEVNGEHYLIQVQPTNG